MRPWVKEDKKIIATSGSHIIHPLWQCAFTHPPLCVRKYLVPRDWRMSVTLLQRKTQSGNIAHPCRPHHEQIPQALSDISGSGGMRQLSLSGASDVRERDDRLQKTGKSGFTRSSRTPHIILAITAKLPNCKIARIY